MPSPLRLSLLLNLLAARVLPARPSLAGDDCIVIDNFAAAKVGEFPAVGRTKVRVLTSGGGSAAAAGQRMRTSAETTPIPATVMPPSRKVIRRSRSARLPPKRAACSANRISSRFSSSSSFRSK